jgi:CheY-like chemotaxis protein
MSTVHAFCPCCGGNVVCKVVDVGATRQARCNNCNFLVAEKPIASPGPVAAPATGPIAAPKVARSLGTVLSAEDQPVIRNTLQQLLVSRGVARKVVAVEQGFDALIAFHQAIRANARLDLLILDVNMPVLDGINAAVCIRAAEKAWGVAPHPILFFTSNMCDDSFRRALDYLAPARYLNKGAGGTVMDLGERLVVVLQNLLAGMAA